MTRVLIITSAAYADAELQAEFGRLPPAMLPIGNRRLFVHQQAAFKAHVSRIILSIPDGFEPGALDLGLLAELGIEVVSVPPGLSLGQSVVYVINVTAAAGAELAILHGDTLLRGLDPAATDSVSVSTAPVDYDWGMVRVSDGCLQPLEDGGEGEPAVLSGYFAFSDAAHLVQAITRAGGSFLGGLHLYARHRPLRTQSGGEWYDFGHANTYHQSRGRVTTQRAFNELQTTARHVVKSGSNTAKIMAEARWFEALPPTLRAYTPAFLGMRETPAGPGYALEYLYLPTLSDLFVFGRLSPGAWTRIFDACDEFLMACSAYPAPPDTAADTDELYGAKTQARLAQFARETGTDIEAACRFNGRALPSLRRMAEIAAQGVPAADPARHLRLIHGDFCFSNILYDARASLVRVIDPRGAAANGAQTPYGDVRYDLAKFRHSIVGRYDHIVSGYFKMESFGPTDVALDMPDEPALSAVEALYRTRTLAGLPASDRVSASGCVLLFLAMLPLHADDPRRQRALMANAMRLFLALDERGDAA